MEPTTDTDWHAAERDTAKWQNALGFADLCELTAQYIEGEVPFFPTTMGPSLDAESAPLVPVLAMLNRSGFLTEMSQPGIPLDGLGDAQRAFVDGFTSESVAKKLATLGLYSDLLVFAVPPGEKRGYQISVTLQDFCPLTWCGALWGNDSFEYFESACGLPAFQEFKQAWRVMIVDLQWGRKDYLWQQVEQALAPGATTGRYSIEPHVTLKLDTKYIF